MPELAIIVPTRGRPENVRKVIGAWDFTNAWDHAHLVLALDGDDPEYQGYADLYEETCHPDTDEPLFSIAVQGVWVPMVHKLNRVARDLADRYWALGFAGDDHLPRTINWAKRYLTVLHELGTGMVYGDDGYQGHKLSTEWAVTSDVVRALGAMVPAPVDHMYCDNAMMDLYGGAGSMRHLPEVRIEHMHPIAGKADNDDQYRKVNSRDQFKKDRGAYERWKRTDMTGQIQTVKTLAPARAVPVARQPAPSRPTPAVRRKVMPVNRRSTVSNSIAPKTLRRVRGATPDEIGVTLADMAAQVPADQAIVELGVFQGRTALLMAWGARQGGKAHVWGIDAWELAANTYDAPFKTAGSRNWARYNVKALGYAKEITLIHGFSLDQAMEWSGPPIGLLFIDADHSYEGCRSDLIAWAPHLADGATIAVDDYGHPDWPGVKEAVDALVSEGMLAPIEIFHERLAVTRIAAPTEVASLVPAGEVSFEFQDINPEAAAIIMGADIPMTGNTPGHPTDVQTGELEGVAEGTPVENLNTFQLRALAKHRGIVLGARKDKRDAMLTALREGK